MHLDVRATAHERVCARDPQRELASVFTHAAHDEALLPAEVGEPEEPRARGGGQRVGALREEQAERQEGVAEAEERLAFGDDPFPPGIDASSVSPFQTCTKRLQSSSGPMSTNAFSKRRRSGRWKAKEKSYRLVVLRTPSTGVTKVIAPESRNVAQRP